MYATPLNIRKTPATANPGVISGVRGSLWGVRVAWNYVSDCIQDARRLSLQLNGELLLKEDVGAAPLMFDITADIEVDIGVADLDVVIELGERVLDGTVLTTSFVIEVLSIPPPLLPFPVCVGLLEDVVDISVMIDGVLSPSRWCR